VFTVRELLEEAASLGLRVDEALEEVQGLRC